MSFNIATFRSQLQFDGARASLFDITFPRLPIISGAGGDEITFKARASSLPGDSVSSINVDYFGREIKVAGTRTLPDWSITVINDEDFFIRNYMEQWMSSLNSHVSNLRSPLSARAGQYQTDATIRQYAKTGQIIKSYKMVGLFPTDVSAIDVDWSSGDTIEEYSITFAYQWWESNTTDATSAIVVGPPAP